MSERGLFYNEDCIEGCRRRVPDASVDLIITDPPYGIEGDKLHRHYNRKEEYVLEGYIEVPAKKYPEFTRAWISEAARILRPGGTIYVVSGYTNLIHIISALQNASLKEVNHIIWKYNFGIFTRKKFISAHYHILYYIKPGGNVTFNTECRYGLAEKGKHDSSPNYRDREDVWIINRENKPGRAKNKNELPTELLIKMIQYSSNEGDLICDLFLGGFSTARAALGLNRRPLGFELSKTAFEHGVQSMKKIEPGYLLRELRSPIIRNLPNQGREWTDADKDYLTARFRELQMSGKTKKMSLEILSHELGRGKWSLIKALDSLPLR